MDRLEQQVRSRLPGSPRETPVAGNPPDAKTLAAVQLLIVRANLQQEQAIASRDPSMMRDTATVTHYVELARLVRQMISAGVTNIRLTALEWGPITQDGDTITATTYETWNTSGPRGGSDQSADRNVYRIIREGGDWKIDANDHPDSEPPGPTPEATPGSASTPGGTTGTPGPIDTPSATPSTQTGSGTSDESAIQDVIQRANAAQVQSFSSGDPAPMRDTATPGYYQEMVRIIQGMRQLGVQSIALESLEWGPINVNGNSATATTFENWATTLPDGSVDRSRDRNEYRLVRQNNTWRIQGDDHPDQLPQLTPGRTV